MTVRAVRTRTYTLKSVCKTTTRFNFWGHTSSRNANVSPPTPLRRREKIDFPTHDLTHTHDFITDVFLFLSFGTRVLLSLAFDVRTRCHCLSHTEMLEKWGLLSSCTCTHTDTHSHSSLSVSRPKEHRLQISEKNEFRPLFSGKFPVSMHTVLAYKH